MTTPDLARTLKGGHDALARGEWRDAFNAFERALTEEESPEALEGLGLAAWWLDLADTVFDARERAYRLYRDQNERAAAARIAVWLAWDSAAFRGEAAVANGWIQRAHRLLEGQPDTPEGAWLELREGSFALDDGNVDKARRHAANAIRLSRASGALDFELMGRALEGFALVTAGDVTDGMRQLDEVNAAVLAGDIQDRVIIALTCCFLIHACERVRDYDRAVEWCTRLKAFCTRWGLRPLFAVCRTQYALVCMWRGTWDEAERELTSAADELAATRPGMTAEGVARLAELRRRQGRLDEAARLFEQADAFPPAALGRAELAFDRGDPRMAAEMAERYLRRLPAHNRTERAAALELVVRSRASLSDREQAAGALAELTSIAHDLNTTPFRASSSLASGVVALAAGDPDGARRHLEDAVDLFRQSGAPFELSRARIELARALGALGRTEPAVEEAQRAIDLLTTIQATAELARATAVLRDVSGGPFHATESPLGLTRREREVLRLISSGLSNQAIGERLFISEHTVHRHVANILTKLDVPSRAAAVALAARHGVFDVE